MKITTTVLLITLVVINVGAFDNIENEESSNEPTQLEEPKSHAFQTVRSFFKSIRRSISNLFSLPIKLIVSIIPLKTIFDRLDSWKSFVVDTLQYSQFEDLFETLESFRDTPLNDWPVLLTELYFTDRFDKYIDALDNKTALIELLKNPYCRGKAPSSEGFEDVLKNLLDYKSKSGDKAPIDAIPRKSNSLLSKRRDLKYRKRLNWEARGIYGDTDYLYDDGYGYGYLGDDGVNPYYRPKLYPQY